MNHSDREPPATSLESLPENNAQAVATGTFGDESVVNSFGMRFLRVDIDPQLASEANDYVPHETYYLQQTELTGTHLQALREFAKQNRIGPKGYLNIHTSQARDYSDLAILMSEYDPKYDYGLPSKSQWIFACKSGYEQRCDEGGDNLYGFTDMLDGDVEVTDELAVLMGRWINNWGEHTGKPKPDCPCEHWTRCNPDADDSLDEIIVGRFTLLPEGSVQPIAE